MRLGVWYASGVRKGDSARKRKESGKKAEGGVWRGVRRNG